MAPLAGVLFGIALLAVLFLYLLLVFLSPSDKQSSTPSELTFRRPSSPAKTEPLPGIDSPGSVDLSVVVPAYNETLRLPPMLTTAVDHLSTIPSRSYEIIIVDDCSSDATSQTALDFGKKYPKADIRVITFQKNRQKGGAVKHGVLHSRGKRILMVDADGASQFRDLEHLWKQLDAVQSGEEGAAVGSRAHLVKSEAVVKRSFIRNLLMYGFHFLLRTVGVGYIHDTQCGFKLFTRSTAQQLFESLHIHGWIFDVELLLLAQKLGIPVAEVPIEWHEIEGSKMSLMRDSINMAIDVLVLRANYTLGRWKPVSTDKRKTE